LPPYCLPRHVTDLILAAVATAAEQLNPGLVERSIDDATAEVASLLAHRYRQPFRVVPEIVRWIVSVVAAWRVVGGITSLMDTEAASDNQWLPIQNQYKRAWDLLEQLAAGKIKLGLEDGDPDREKAHVAVVAPKPIFDLSKY